ncbi:hypothetical protein MUO79_09465, partial [Candidatus Bathyarchaeota archaeon]|nr:hypothetical protein [Candidatus Bathyarchaeota archaeon]
FLCSYAHAKILIEERLNQSVISSGNVQRDTFILVHALAVQIPLSRKPLLQSNQIPVTSYVMRADPPAREPPLYSLSQPGCKAVKDALMKRHLSAVQSVE